MRPHGPGNRFRQVFIGGDHNFFPAGFQEAQRGLNFWPHVSWREVSSLVVSLQLEGRHIPQFLLGGLFVVEIHEGNVGRDGKRVHVQLRGQ